MKILIYSRAFRPSIGGLETMMEILAEEFTAAGHRVKVVTQIAGKAEDDHDYEVVRLPSLRLYLELLRWSDVCLCANVSLRGLLPIMIARTPLVISHQGGYGSPGRMSLVAEFKKAVTRFSKNICCSQAVESCIPGPSIIIPNTYRCEVFKEHGDVARDLDIIFVGRLVSDKGVSDLIDALSVLGGIGLRPRLSIVGDGPERPAILARVEELGLDSQVSFTGIKRGCDLASFIARHRLMAVPSRGRSRSGLSRLRVLPVVAWWLARTRLDCRRRSVLVVSPCPMGTALQWREHSKLLLEDDGLRASYRSYAPGHLARHSRSIVARRYLDVLESVTSCKASRGCSQLRSHASLTSQTLVGFLL